MNTAEVYKSHEKGGDKSLYLRDIPNPLTSCSVAEKIVVLH